MTARQKGLKLQSWMTPNDLRQLPDGMLGEAAAGFIGQWLSAKAELQHDAFGTVFELSEKSFGNVAGVRVALGGASLRPSAQRGLHPGIAHWPVINVRGNVN